MKSWWLLPLGVVLGVAVGFLAVRKVAVAPTINPANVPVGDSNVVTNAAGNTNASLNSNANSRANVNGSGGSSFAEDIGNALEKADTITVSAPKPNVTIASPLTVSGQARGTWFFEGEFRVQLLDGSGTEVVAANATAKGEWMTTAFVPFELTLGFDRPKTARGTLVLHKANPSGLAAQDDELRLPVKF